MTDWDSLDSILGRFQQVSDDEAGTLEQASDATARMQQISEDDAAQTVKLKGMLAKSTFGVIGLQLLIADIAFFSYGSSNDWKIDAEVMMSWLAATVIEVLGVVIIIARHLFPSKPGE